MSKAIGEIAAGAALIALDVLAPYVGIPLKAALASGIVAAGSSLVLGGIGTLLTKQQQGLVANARNPIQPRNVVYGQATLGGTVVYIEETGTSNKYQHMIYVLATHPCNSIDAILFDGKRVPMDTSGNSISFGDSTTVIGHQQTVNIASIARIGSVVTVVMSGPMPAFAATAAGPTLMTGDTIQIQNVTADQTLNGQYQIQLVNSTTFTYVCGGNPISISGQGQAKTTWPDYGDTVHAEYALGNQFHNPFPGLTAAGESGSNGLWTNAHTLNNCTAVYLRMKYGGQTYAAGVPAISFLLSGKNDIYDPRTGGTGYTTNAALCIADYLSNSKWGFKAAYTAEIPLLPLQAAANICDETVPLANGSTEKRYTCNGSFQLSAKRGEILQNLLTACGGRLSYVGGQFFIYPAAWIGPLYWLGTNTPSAVLSVVSSYSHDASFGPVARMSVTGAFFPDAGGSIFTSSFVYSTAAYSTRTNQVVLDPNQAASLSSLTLYAEVWNSLFGSGVAQLNIYDVWVDVTYADGTTAKLRPTVATALAGDGVTTGTITNASNAVDGDPSTFATVTRTTTSAGLVGPVLTVSGWANATVTPAPGPQITALNALTNSAGPFQWKPKVAIRDLYNGVKATYICPANNWQPSDMPPYAQDQLHGYATDANLTADGGDRRYLDLQFPFTNSTATAQRLAKIELLRKRQQGAGTFIFNLALYQCTALDVLSMTLPYFPGWTNKLLEITQHRFTANKQEGENGALGMVLGTEIDVQETDPSVYAWSASEELSAQGYASGTTGVQIVAAPVGATATSGTAVAVGTGNLMQSRVQISLPAPVDGYVTNGGTTLVQYQVTGTNTWTAVGNYDSSTSTAYINGVSDGTSYTPRIAYVSAQGIQSPWTVLPPVVASGGNLNMHFADDETPSGVINGSNQTFTLAHIPTPATSLNLYLNGVWQSQLLDYTVSSSTITLLTSTPKSGDWLRASYRY